MPELPEVQTMVDDLKKKVLNRTFLDVWTDSKKFSLKEIKGKKILNVWRRAKNILIDLSGGYILLIHNKMTGHLLFGEWKMVNNKWAPLLKGPFEDKKNGYIRLMFFLDKGMLALSDLRRFAKVELKKREEVLKKLSKLGPEPLEDSFTFDKFKKVLKKGKIKQVLMNPEIIAGIGNIYSDEILWWSKVNPLRNATSLKEKELREIFKNIKKVLNKAVKLRGESFADFRDLEGKKGFFDDERKAYQREGEKCSRCKTVMKRIKIGGRSSIYCPYCQKP